MDMENWIHVHVNMFQYFGGSAVMLVPDNLKTGVDHTNDWYTPQLNRTYQELAEHYNTAVVPARVRKPKRQEQCRRHCRCGIYPDHCRSAEPEVLFFG